FRRASAKRSGPVRTSGWTTRNFKPDAGSIPGTIIFSVSRQVRDYLLKRHDSRMTQERCVRSNHIQIVECSICTCTMYTLWENRDAPHMIIIGRPDPSYRSENIREKYRRVHPRPF